MDEPQPASALAIARALIRCPSITPADAGALDVLERLLAGAGFGTHRVPLESNYLEVYHRPNVKAVSVKDNPIVEIVPEGIKLADGTVHELDVIILATGFDAGSGALTRIDIYGRDGRLLRDEWSREIRTTMGLMVHGYPESSYMWRHVCL